MGAPGRIRTCAPASGGRYPVRHQQRTELQKHAAKESSRRQLTTYLPQVSAAAPSSAQLAPTKRAVKLGGVAPSWLLLGSWTIVILVARACIDVTTRQATRTSRCKRVPDIVDAPLDEAWPRTEPKIVRREGVGSRQEMRGPMGWSCSSTTTAESSSVSGTPPKPSWMCPTSSRAGRRAARMWSLVSNPPAMAPARVTVKISDWTAPQRCSGAAGNSGDEVRQPLGVRAAIRLATTDRRGRRPARIGAGRVCCSASGCLYTN